MKPLRRLRPSNKVPAWKRKKLEQQKSNRDVAQAKWLHHCVKGIHKALKLAKQFEIKKVSRRVVQAKQTNASDNAAQGSEGALAKFEQQLQTLKNMDLDKLAQQAAAQAGFAEASAAPTGSQAGVEAVLGQRLLGAACVVKQLEASGKDFRKKFGSDDKAEEPAAASSEDGADVPSTGEASDEEVSLHSDASDGEAAGPIELDDVAAAALEKLRSGRLTTAAGTAAAAASGSEDSSGAISLPSVSVSSDEEDDDVATTSKPVNGKRKRDSTAKGAAKGPPAKRMGQRARRALYEQKYGLQANHLAKQLQLQQAAAPAAAQKVRYPGPPPVAEQQPNAAAAADGESLHPSWEAKRLQKAALAAAGQAKKVVFGEDDGAEPVVLAAPAAAKTARTASITAPAAASDGVKDAITNGSDNAGLHGRGRSGRGRGSPGRGAVGQRSSSGTFGRGGGRGPGFGRGAGRSAGRAGGGGGYDAGGGGRTGVGSSRTEHRGRGSGRGGRSGDRAPLAGRSSSGRGRGDAGFIPVAEMHPSWQAKKLQAAAQPAGKKVVFADD